MTRLADQIMCKVQIAIKLGKVEGYLRPLGSNAIKFLSINQEVGLREFGIFLEDVMSDSQREALYAELSAKESQGLIMPQDKIKVMSCKNMKQAQIYLAYVTNKRIEENRQFEMQKIQQQVQGNAQVAAAAEQMKQQTIQLQGQIDAHLVYIEKMLEYEIERMKKSSDIQEGSQQADAKTMSSIIAGHAKILSQQIAADAQKHVAKKKTA
jgi:hypothetical protein